MCWTACQVGRGVIACLFAYDCFASPGRSLHGSKHKHVHAADALGVADAKELERMLPMLVALRGRVDSGDPKKCELSDRRAVIHEVCSDTAMSVLVGGCGESILALWLRATNQCTGAAKHGDAAGLQKAEWIQWQQGGADGNWSSSAGCVALLLR